MYWEAITVMRERGTGDYIGESVTQIEHVSQAGYFAFNYILNQTGSECERKKFVVAAFFHDIGHLLMTSDFSRFSMEGGLVKIEDMIDPETSCNLGVLSHEHIGAAFLRLLQFPTPIPELVESHVDAKRYRVGKDPVYANQLSDASRRTLNLQGGPMDFEERNIFESSPHFSNKLALRQCDEKAKETTIPYGEVDLNDHWNRRDMLSVIPSVASFEKFFSVVLG